MVNPNRTQRFVYHKGVFKEVYDTPIQRAIDPKTLTSFLNFCKKEYPADHNMLLYRSHILYNGKDAYLSFSWDRDNEVFNIDGVRGVSPYQYSGGMLNAEYSPDPINYLVNSRMVT